MTTAASLSDLAHSYENIVGLMYSTIKSTARDNRSSYVGEMSILKDKIKIEWAKYIKDRKAIHDKLAAGYPATADLIFEGGVAGTRRWIERSSSGLED